MHVAKADCRTPETAPGQHWAQRADELLARLRRRADSGGGGVEVVTPGAGVAPHVFGAAAACSSDSISLEPAPTSGLPILGTDRETEACYQIQDGMAERGVLQRIVRAEPGVSAEDQRVVKALAAAGQPARHHPDVPLRLLGFDRRVVFAPLDPEHTRAGGYVVRATALVEAWYELFEEIWAQAAPRAQWPTLETPDESMELRVLRLLAEGLKDETIARRLELSDRTVRRVVAQLQRDYCASSRFQLAVMAAGDDQPLRSAGTRAG